jgi:excisionase family DNA binding protein
MSNYSAKSDHNLMTVKETAAYLRIPLPTVYYLVQRGQLPAVQIGGRWRVKRDLLDRDILRNEEEQGGAPTVLVVDDDTGLQGMFKLFLKKQGFTRIVVGTGKEALAALNKQKFDLCFLDLQLPDITGDEIYKQAKALHPELPIVIITGYPDSQMLDNILKHGPVTVLKKPLEVEVLERALRMLGHEVKAKAA